ncbi:MAG: DUF1730 domain-containing protein, partial [Chromatiales bacterium]|nr:DUF1730 domain-containing protein [Chromatiales bacterium]
MLTPDQPGELVPPPASRYINGMQIINTPSEPHLVNFEQLTQQIKTWGETLGFQQIGIADTQLEIAEQRFDRWLAQGFHGEMEYMSRHGKKRSRPELLVPGTLRVISVRMDYLPANDDPWQVLGNDQLGYISRYALGRDYHKMMRNRLQKLAKQIETAVGTFGYRV